MPLPKKLKEYAEGREGTIDLWIPVTLAIILTFIAIIAGPFIPAPLVILGSVALIKVGYGFGLFKDTTFKDYLIIGIVLLVAVIGYLFMLGHAFLVIPLWQLIIIAIIADIIAFGLGWLEGLGYTLTGPFGTIISIISGIVVFMFVNWGIGGGIPGIILGGLAAVGAVIPGPIPVTTIMFLLLYFGVHWIIDKIWFLKYLI